jgi:hypothetical protein
MKQEDGKESISGIWDCRDDKEGIIYGLKGSDQIRSAETKPEVAVRTLLK